MRTNFISSERNSVSVEKSVYKITERSPWASPLTISILEKLENPKWNKGCIIEMNERKILLFLFFYTEDSVINLWGSMWL